MATKRATLLTNYLPKLTTPSLRPPPNRKPLSLSHFKQPTPPSSSSLLTKRYAYARFAHSIPRPPKPPPPSTTPSTTTQSSQPSQKQPSYELTFTCIPCSTRSRHIISKQGYHHGSVLIACPSCKNRHVISDHLKIFGDKNITVEDILREKGQLVKKGVLSNEDDLEFWDDGTETVRGEDEGQVMRYKTEEGAEEKLGAPPGASFRVYGEKEGEKEDE
ncbi:DNL zinc finger-domain-containing protein [Podospora fimiseda]|uniref:DNL zinc finger-domain-containing protein n=1 Tax=Podospora fimiseda TaxID=252190 RepID=A0AAN7BUR0_9PEZI|nr:DNL zinc finger-domain-containing protein [Podospora fimiseda]